MSSVVEKMLRELGYDLDKKKEELDFLPNETKGYESLVTKEEFEAIKKIVEAVDNFIDVHNHSTLENVTKIFTSTPYARIQYTALSDITREVMNSVGALANIHKMDKKMIDDAMYESGETDIKEYEKSIITSAILKHNKG